MQVITDCLVRQTDHKPSAEALVAVIFLQTLQLTVPSPVTTRTEECGALSGNLGIETYSHRAATLVYYCYKL